MTRRAVVLVGALAAVTFCGLVEGVAKAADKKEEEAIVRYRGRSWGKAWGRRVMRIHFSKIGSRAKKTVVVPNGKDNKPLPAIKKVVKTIKDGDYIKLTIGKDKGVPVVKKLAQFKIKPGEDDPSGYIFVEADEEVVRGKRVWIVTLKKFEKEIMVQAATEKDAKGKERTDPNMAAKFEKFKTDKVVDVELSGSKRSRVLVYFGEYMAPVEGVFTELIDKSKDDPNKTAIKATVFGKTKTYFLRTTVVRGKVRVNKKLLGIAKKLKPGDLVEIKPRPYGKDQQLAIRITKLKKSKDDDL